MVEQNVKKALAVADRGYVIERGTLVASGPAKLLARSTVMREAYLGAQSSDTTTAADAAYRGRAQAPPERGGGAADVFVCSRRRTTMSDLSMLINGLKVTAEKRRHLRAAQPAGRHGGHARARRVAGRCGDGGRGRRRSLQDAGAKPARASGARCC